MNRENMRSLADALQNNRLPPGVAFSMRYLKIEIATILRGRETNLVYTSRGPQRMGATDCGTVACIAGVAAILSGHVGPTSVAHTARAWLGLTQDQADDLFYPFVDNEYWGITPQHAADVLLDMLKRDAEQPDSTWSVLPCWPQVLETDHDDT